MLHRARRRPEQPALPRRRDLGPALAVAVGALLGASPAAAAEPESTDISPPPAAEADPESAPEEPTPPAPTIDADPAAAEADPESAPEDSTPPAAADDGPAPRPPRIDGPYLGTAIMGGIGLLRLNNIDTDRPFATGGATLTVGQMVFPWLGLGLHGGGGGGTSSAEGARQRLGQGFIGMEFRFVPLPKRIPLSLLGSLGFGGGAVRQAGVSGRSGFGGAQFGVAARYEWFPGAARYRPDRGGGLGLGPQIGWLGFTPAAKGRPMSNVLYAALSVTWYFGD